MVSFWLQRSQMFIASEGLWFPRSVGAQRIYVSLLRSEENIELVCCYKYFASPRRGTTLKLLDYSQLPSVLLSSFDKLKLVGLAHTFAHILDVISRD
jgi:hypothetical protein